MTEAMPEPIIPPSQLVRDLRALGLAPGQVVMLHTSVKAVGAVMGGPNTLIQALLDVLGGDGTLMMYAGWQDIPDFVDDLPADTQALYLAEYPPFDPATARAVRDNSVLAEFLRTWPGAQRSDHPEASMVAVGAQAAHLTQDHPLHYGYGLGSPLHRLIDLRGQVLMLGAPLDTLTLLHYAENRARMRHKAVVHYRCPLLRDGQRVWVAVEDYDTSEPHADYSLEQIARAYLATGQGQRGRVGAAESYLFDAAGVAAFGIAWLEQRYGA